jgi:hypothetical protein
MFTEWIDKYNIAMPLVVAPSFNIQFITFCIMYVLLSPLMCQQRTNETARCCAVIKPNVSVAKGCAEVHVTRPLVASISLKAG